MERDLDLLSEEEAERTREGLSAEITEILLETQNKISSLVSPYGLHARLSVSYFSDQEL